MSSFPQHKDNLEKLKAIGFDTSEYDEDPYESWDYDVLVDMVSDLIKFIELSSNKTTKTKRSK